MGLTAETISRSLDDLASRDARIAQALTRVGYPLPRIRDRGFATLLRTIIGQQVSVAAAAAIWERLEQRLGTPLLPGTIAALDDATLRSCGLSRQKALYARSLAEHIETGRLDLADLPCDDEEAIARLSAVHGIGRWSAEIYLMFAEGRHDIWPAGDLAVREGLGRILELPVRPTEGAVRRMGDAWRPHRSALALFTWHVYASSAL